MKKLNKKKREIKSKKEVDVIYLLNCMRYGWNSEEDKKKRSLYIK